MAYSRKAHRKLLAISDAIGGILDAEERLDDNIQKVLERAFEDIELALVQMHEAHIYFAQKKLQKAKASPGLTFELGHVDTRTGEVIKSVVLTKESGKEIQNAL